MSTMMDLINKRKDQQKVAFLKYINKEILELYKKGMEIPYKLYCQLKLNGYERKLLLKLIDDRTLIEITKFALKQQKQTQKLPTYSLPTDYLDAVNRMYIHEIIRRYEEALKDAE